MAFFPMGGVFRFDNVKRSIKGRGILLQVIPELCVGISPVSS
jgi:hypothetical protein